MSETHAFSPLPADTLYNVNINNSAVQNQSILMESLVSSYISNELVFGYDSFHLSKRSERVEKYSSNIRLNETQQPRQKKVHIRKKDVWVWGCFILLSSSLIIINQGFSLILIKQYYPAHTCPFLDSNTSVKWKHKGPISEKNINVTIL